MNPQQSAFGMVIDKMFADQERRHEWLIRAGEQIRQSDKLVDRASRPQRHSEGDLAAPTVAGAPSGLSPSRSQAKAAHRLSQRSREMMPDYEAWRPALISFYRVESPWMTQKRENLERGDQLTHEDRRIIDALIVAGERAPLAA